MLTNIHLMMMLVITIIPSAPGSSFQDVWDGQDVHSATSINGLGVFETWLLG